MSPFAAFSKVSSHSGSGVSLYNRVLNTAANGKAISLSPFAGFSMVSSHSGSGVSLYNRVLNTAANGMAISMSPFAGFSMVSSHSGSGVSLYNRVLNTAANGMAISMSPFAGFSMVSAHSGSGVSLYNRVLHTAANGKVTASVRRSISTLVMVKQPKPPLWKILWYLLKNFVKGAVNWMYGWLMGGTLYIFGFVKDILLETEKKLVNWCSNILLATLTGGTAIVYFKKSLGMRIDVLIRNVLNLSALYKDVTVLQYQTKTGPFARKTTDRPLLIGPDSLPVLKEE